MKRKLNVLLYGDIDLNIMDGSAIWLTSLANTLNYDPNINMDLLLKARIKNNNLISEVDYLEQVNIINTFSRFNKKRFDNGNRMNINEAINIMEGLHTENNYDCIIVRGFPLVKELLKYPDLVQITIPYITDFTHDIEKINNKEKSLLKQIYNLFPQMFIQTPQMGELLKKIIDEDGAKLNLLLPMIPDHEEEPDFKNQNNSLVYAGKFAKDWYTEEMINAFGKINGLDSGITLNIVGNKFQGEFIPRREEISNLMKEQKGIHWKGGVSRSKSLEIIKQSDLGISWRSDNIDNDNSVELSTKLLEYGRLGKPVLLRKTKMHEDFLGKDYPLFVEDEENFIKKSIEVLNNRKLYRKAARRLYDSCKKYTFYEAYKRLKPILWSFNSQKVKLLFAGHDFKFINMAIDYFKDHPSYEIKIDQWQGHIKHNEESSKEYLEWADVIFCEWGLGNAVWYSTHKKKGQKLIVRMHLQERETEHPSKFRLENIDKIVAISPFIYEEFHRVNKIPRDKMTMIYNMIDTDKYNKPKHTNQNIMFNLGICGILPSRKRIDRALNIFEKLWEKDNRYKLFVKSRLPKELPWLMNRENEKEYYDDVFERIKKSPWGKNVIFDKHGDDMDEWFRKIGFVLSTSDFESFHLAPIEGMASGSIPLILSWPGAETIYPKEYIFNYESDIIKYVLKNNRKGISNNFRQRIKSYPKLNYSKENIICKIEELLVK